MIATTTTNLNDEEKNLIYKLITKAHPDKVAKFISLLKKYENEIDRITNPKENTSKEKEDEIINKTGEISEDIKQILKDFEKELKLEKAVNITEAYLWLFV